MKFLWVLIVAAVLVAADDVDDTDDVEVVNTTPAIDLPATGVIDVGNSSTAGRSSSRRPNSRFFGGLGNIIGTGAAIIGGVLGGGGRPVRPPSPGFGGQNPGFGGQNPGFGGQNPGFGGQTPGFGGQNHGFGGQNPGFGGQNPGFGGQNPGFGGQNPGFGGQNPGFGGQNPGFGGQTPGFGGQNPGFGGQNPGFGGQNSGFGGQNPGFGGQNSGFGGQNPGFGGPVTGGCRFWCRTPQGQAYCCETSNQGQGGSFPFTKPGQCPPVRPSCPPTRNFIGPPQTCSSDSRCPGVDKCCFDTCLQEHVCKPPLGVGK